MVLDTNILLTNEEVEGEVLYSVLTELDRQKVLAGELGYKARRAIRRIQKNPDKFKLVFFELGNETVDDNLIEYCLAHQVPLCTKDLSLKLKAEAKGVQVVFLISGSRLEYNPIKYLETDEEVADFFEGKLGGEYCIINGFAHKNTGLRKQIFHKGFGDLVPRNTEQHILFSELSNPNKKVFVVTSGMGCGKSFVLLSYALSELKAGRIKKIIMVGNNSAVENARELGTLPGTLLEKEMVYCSPLLNLMTTEELVALHTSNQLEVVPLSVIRGRNFDDSIVYVSEAQNLNTSHIKLLLGRVGNNSKIFFDGDIKQIDNYKFKESSGLGLLAKLHADGVADFISYVVLKNVERSEVAQLADLIDKEYADEMF